jgi:hypothetical protein
LKLPVNKILHNTPTLKDSNLLAIAESVRDGWNAAVGIDLEEPGFFLGVFGELDFGRFVWEPVSGSASLLEEKNFWE